MHANEASDGHDCREAKEQNAVEHDPREDATFFVVAGDEERDPEAWE